MLQRKVNTDSLTQTKFIFSFHFIAEMCTVLKKYLTPQLKHASIKSIHILTIEGFEK